MGVVLRRCWYGVAEEKKPKIPHMTTVQYQAFISVSAAKARRGAAEHIRATLVTCRWRKQKVKRMSVLWAAKRREGDASAARKEMTAGLNADLAHMRCKEKLSQLRETKLPPGRRGKKEAESLKEADYWFQKRAEVLAAKAKGVAKATAKGKAKAKAEAKAKATAKAKAKALAAKAKAEAKAKAKAAAKSNAKAKALAPKAKAEAKAKALAAAAKGKAKTEANAEGDDDGENAEEYGGEYHWEAGLPDSEDANYDALMHELQSRKERRKRMTQQKRSKRAREESESEDRGEREAEIKRIRASEGVEAAPASKTSKNMI